MRSRAGPLLCRLRLAGGRFPSLGGWLEVTLLALAFSVVALPLARSAELIGTSWRLPPSELLPLALRVLLVPALLEEVVFRVLPNPHASETVGPASLWWSAIASLAVYLLVHPLAALFSVAIRPVFLDPAFLALVVLLGTVCLIAYRRTGSLWSAVFLHWLIVVGWLGLGGQGPLFRPG
jgi:predicted Abi (CAAX) family protease